MRSGNPALSAETFAHPGYAASGETMTWLTVTRGYQRQTIATATAVGDPGEAERRRRLLPAALARERRR